jgi:hypothetical protein
MPTMTNDKSDKPDPADMFRELLGQWENIATEFGSGLLKSGEIARTVSSATAATSKARSIGGEVVTRALAAANLPGREELATLTNRVQSIEERLARIESLLTLPAEPKAKKSKSKTTKAATKKG